MSGVLALVLEQIALSHGTVPRAVPLGQSPKDGTNGTSETGGTVGTVGTVGTLGTAGTLPVAYLDGEPAHATAIDERAAFAAGRAPSAISTPGRAFNSSGLRTSRKSPGSKWLQTRVCFSTPVERMRWRWVGSLASCSTYRAKGGRRVWSGN